MQRGGTRRGQIHRRRQKTFLAKPYLIPLRRASSCRSQWHSQQLRFLGRLQRAPHNRIAITKRHFARGHTAQVPGHAIVNLVTQQQVSQNLVPARGTKVNILEENFVEVAFDVPPVSRLLPRHHQRKEVLPLANRNLLWSGLQRHHFPGRISQQQQVAARQLPQVARCVLDGCRIVRSHQRPHIRQVGQQRRRALERNFPLFLKVVECGNGILQVALDSHPHLLLHSVPYYQQRRERQCGRYHHHGKQELGPQPNSAHGQTLEGIIGDRYKRSEVRSQIAEVKSL